MATKPFEIKKSKDSLVSRFYFQVEIDKLQNSLLCAIGLVKLPEPVDSEEEDAKKKRKEIVDTSKMNMWQLMEHEKAE